MVGLIDGSLSTLAPIFSVALISHKPFYAFVAGLCDLDRCRHLDGLLEGLSDTGELTGRGNPMVPRQGSRAWGRSSAHLHSLPIPGSRRTTSRLSPRSSSSARAVALAILRARFFSTSSRHPGRGLTRGSCDRGRQRHARGNRLS